MPVFNAINASVGPTVPRHAVGDNGEPRIMHGSLRPTNRPRRRNAMLHFFLDCGPYPPKSLAAISQPTVRLPAGSLGTSAERNDRSKDVTLGCPARGEARLYCSMEINPLTPIDVPCPFFVVYFEPAVKAVTMRYYCDIIARNDFDGAKLPTRKTDESIGHHFAQYLLRGN